MSNAAFLHVTRADAIKSRLYALGRMKAGTMNRTEEAYAAHLETRRYAGEIAWWKFEGIKLRLADNTFLTVDFALMLASGELELHDCKGSPAIFTDDARAKMKIAADMYPFQFFVVYPRAKKLGGGWNVERIG